MQETNANVFDEGIQDVKFIGQLSPDELEKRGYDRNIKDLYASTFDKIINAPQKGDFIQGTVVDITGHNALLDIGYTESAYLDISKEKSEYVDYISIGNTVDVKVISNPTKRGFIEVSFSDAVKQTKYNEIYNSINENVAYVGVVKELVHGGYRVVIDGIDTFMPGSLGGINKLHDFNVLLGKELLVKPVNFERNNIVVSHRHYLRMLIPGKIEEIQENDKGTLYTGFVTGTTQYGVFCEFNECLTGMIFKNDLTEEMIARHENRNIKPGDQIEFYIKEIISNKKIILSQSFVEDPWDNIESKYKPSDRVKCKVTSVKQYGYFVELEQGISSLLHLKENSNEIVKVGDIMEATITSIDKNNKKIYLKH